MLLKIALDKYSSQWKQDHPPSMSFSMATSYFSVFQTQLQILIVFEATP
jgi:hypothetical protein